MMHIDNVRTSVIFVECYTLQMKRTVFRKLDNNVVH